VSAVLSDKIFTKIEQSKSLIMRLVGIVASVLVSGRYYNGGGAIDINGVNTSKSMLHSVLNSQRTTRAWSRNEHLHIFMCGCWNCQTLQYYGLS